MQTLSNRFNLGSKKPVTGFSTRRPLVNLCVKRICLVLMLSFVSCCCGVPVVGLHPEYPPVKKKTFSLYSEFVEVNSLQPTFRWQPFPGPEDDFADRIHDVTYELRIWTTVPRRSGKLMYARDGLELASHMLEKGLNLKKLQLMMGHSTMQTTAIYLHVTNTDTSIIPDLAISESNKELQW